MKRLTVYLFLSASVLLIQAGCGRAQPDHLVDQPARLSMEAVTRKPEEPAQTKMNLQPGVDRLWQNGPSQEEIRRARSLPSRKPVRVETYGGWDRPVMDLETEEI